jgi:Bacterial regulatory helix-turn-helix protein, lysR family
VNLRDLRSFVIVADAGGFARASGRLNLTQPAASRQILALEQELGIALFDRIGRRIELTSDGEDLLRRSRRLLEDAASLGERARPQGWAYRDVARRRSHSNDREPAGTIRRAVPASPFPAGRKRPNNLHRRVIRHLSFLTSRICRRSCRRSRTLSSFWSQFAAYRHQPSRFSSPTNPGPDADFFQNGSSRG